MAQAGSIPSPRLEASRGTQSIASQAVTGELQGLLAPPFLSATGDERRGGLAEEEEDGLGVRMGVGQLFHGAYSDWRRRGRHLFTTDYTDGFRWQTLSAGLFTFFGVLATTISLGHRIQSVTEAQTGFLEYMLANSAAGLAYATLESQPYVVVQPTGPITMLLEMLSECAKSQGFEFLPFVAVTGLFVSLWLIAASALNLACLLAYMSRFTGEVFACFIGTAYIRDGIAGLAHRFEETRSPPSSSAPTGDETNIGDALMSLNLGILVFVLASWLATGLHGPRLCVTPLRNFFSSYALTIAITLVTVLCHLVLSRRFTIAYLDVPETPGGTSLTVPTRVHAQQYWTAVRELYNATHFPNGSLAVGLPRDHLQHSAPRPGPLPEWVHLANAAGGTQLRESWFVGLPTSSEARAGAMYAWGLLYSIPIVRCHASRANSATPPPASPPHRLTPSHVFAGRLLHRRSARLRPPRAAGRAAHAKGALLPLRPASARRAQLRPAALWPAIRHGRVAAVARAHHSDGRDGGRERGEARGGVR